MIESLSMATVEPQKKQPTSKLFKTVPSSFTGHILTTHNLTKTRIHPKTMQRLRYKVRMQMQQEYDHLSILQPTTSTRIPLKSKTFGSGSMYSGEWCYDGIDGAGIYRFPDGSLYTGLMVNGLFAGYGALRFPNGGIMKGFWIQGVLYNPEYVFQDGLKYKPNNWKYCRMPDRRFHSEIVNGLKPSGNIQFGSDHPVRAIPPGHYDLVEGFYNPISNEVIHPITGNILRIASRNEHDWILNNCRREWEIPVPFNPYLYENWFPKVNEGRHKYVSKNSLWMTAMSLAKERTGVMFRIYSITKKWPRLLKESVQNLIEIGSQMDRSNIAALKRRAMMNIKY